MVFCNLFSSFIRIYGWVVTILILIDGFLQFNGIFELLVICIVTILILIDGFLQLKINKYVSGRKNRHNPYFNRWFSAINNINLFKKALNASQSLF